YKLIYLYCRYAFPYVYILTNLSNNMRQFSCPAPIIQAINPLKVAWHNAVSFVLSNTSMHNQIHQRA
ncbi:MAG: hypothetical protein PHV55_06935, partial [Candidatus Omnitrophica bacterium]|nr:hypothetical protein [Candidatus Omnitrophota bacterium]